MSYCIGFLVSDEAEAQSITQELFPQEVAQKTVLVRAVHPDQVMAAARELIQSGAQALVARGGNFRDLKAVITEVPLVELIFRTSDVLDVLGAQPEGYDEIWLVLSKFIRFDFDSCRPFLPEKVHCFRYGPVSEMRAFLATLEAPANTLVVGSGFVRAPAQARGFSVAQISSSLEGTRESYATALKILRERDKEAAKARQIATILSNIEDGVVVLDNKSRVTLCNRKAEELLGLSFEALRGKDLIALLPAMAPVSEAYLRHKTSDKLVRIQDHALSVNMSPVTDLSDGVPVGGVLLTLRDVTKLQELEKNLRFQLSKKGLTARYHFSDILTQDSGMLRVISQARRYAETDNTVVLYGQSGTGKELFAQSIHNHSHRKSSPFVAVNCAALSESLLESELFGYVGGAFTGARKEGKAGLFELAHGGTIFLDEINSMSPSTQAKILRVIEEREVMRIGSDYIIPLDVRILAAANEDLVEMVKADKFRRDLFFRLNVLELHIPTLNDRPKDIPYLFQLFVAELRGCMAQDIKLSSELRNSLSAHNWWGNVRELRNTAQKYAVLGEDFPLDSLLSGTSEDTPVQLLDDSFRVDLKALDRVVEGMVIESLLSRGLTKTQTAKAIGISRTALFKKMELQKQKDMEG